MKIGIDAPLGRISDKIASHKAAWAYLWQAQFNNLYEGEHEVKVLHKNESWDDYDMIYIDHGMEFKGSLNLFGGANEETYTKAKRFLDYEGKIFSLDHEMPLYGEMLSGRIGNKTTYEEITQEFCDNLDEKCKEIKPIFQADFKTNTLCFGDSHSFSRYEPPAMCNRNDGQTLYGALNRELWSFIEPFLKDGNVIDHLIIKLGDIDVRHHLCRQDDPEESLRQMLDEYERQLRELSMKFSMDITLCELLPIEDESRKLPKTGYYKDAPFAGTREERDELANIFNTWLEDKCRHYDWRLIKYPEFMRDADPIKFMEYMEKPKSVHLSRQFYHWDFEKNCLNEFKIDEDVKSTKQNKKPEVEKLPQEPNPADDLLVF